MTTCLNITTCPNDKLYDIRCNFITNYLGNNYEYACNPDTTCMRTDGIYDCCGGHIVECIVYASSLRIPTFQPTTQPSIIVSETNCNENCTTNKTAVYIYILFGCIAGIMISIIFAYYWKSRNKIVPVIGV